MEATSANATRIFAGPVRQAIGCATRMGMRMVDAFSLEGEDGSIVSLLESDDEQFQHDLRELLRTKLWREVAHRRPSEFGGMDVDHTSVDREATMALHNKVKGTEKNGCYSNCSQVAREPEVAP